MKIAYWIVTGLFCLMMFAAAAIEIFAIWRIRQNALPAWISPISLPTFCRSRKFLGRIAILTRYSKTLTEWAYAGFFFDFVLAALAHYFSGVPSPIPAIVALVFLMTSYALGKRVYCNGADSFNNFAAISIVFPQFSDYRCQHPNTDCRKPYPDYLARDNRPASVAEKSQTNRRDFDGSPRKEISFIAERRKQCHARTAVGQHIQQRMRKCGERKIDEKFCRRNPGWQKSLGEKTDDAAEN